MSGSLLETTVNTRDIGGYVTLENKIIAHDKIYRSEAQLDPSEKDIAFLRAKGMTTIIDMRTKERTLQKPSGFAQRQGFDYFNYPIEAGSRIPESVEAVPGAYMSIANDGNMKQILKTIAGAQSGVMYNCTAGKDRTGVLTAILLLLCGVKQEDIIADYMRTKENLHDQFRAIAQQYPQVNMEIVIPRPSYLIDFMELFEKQYGTAEQYMLKIGLSRDEIHQIKSKLLDA